jgi:MYXO-CTERM domain-containing protein
MKTTITIAAVATAAIAVTNAANAAIYNFTFARQGTSVSGPFTTAYDIVATGQLTVVGGVITAGSMSVVDNSVVSSPWDAPTGNIFVGDNVGGTYTLFAGNGTGSLQSNTGMGFDNLFGASLPNPFTVVPSDSFQDYYTAGGALFANPNGTFGTKLFAFMSLPTGEILVKLRVGEGDASRFDGGTFTYSEVPAPGALAVLGVAGFVAARRRRS